MCHPVNTVILSGPLLKSRRSYNLCAVYSAFSGDVECNQDTSGQSLSVFLQDVLSFPASRGSGWRFTSRRSRPRCWLLTRLRLEHLGGCEAPALNKTPTGKKIYHLTGSLDGMVQLIGRSSQVLRRLGKGPWKRGRDPAADWRAAKSFFRSNIESRVAHDALNLSDLRIQFSKKSSSRLSIFSLAVDHRILVWWMNIVLSFSQPLPAKADGC
jgi:hypothetical protein